MFCSVTHLTRFHSSLLDKTKEFAQDLSPALLNNLIAIGCAILVKETLNLNKLKNQIGTLLGNQQTQPDSHYRRLTRFFDSSIAQRKLWKWLLVWMIGSIKRWDGRSMSFYLTLDATCWQLGKQPVQLLVLCLIYRQVSLPLLWIDLAKKGHSTQKEPKGLLKQAIKLYPLKGFCLLADREYEGKDWFKFLTDSGLQFIIRLPRQAYKEAISAGGRSYGSLLRQALKGRLIGQFVDIEGYRYQFVALCHQLGPTHSDPLVLLLSNSGWSKRQIADRYRLRWTTECFFKHLKSNGFDLEDLGFHSLPKIRLLVSIVVVLYVLCVAEGFRAFRRIRPKKQLMEVFLARESVFRRGYSVVANQLATIEQFIDWLMLQIRRPLKVPIRLFFFHVQH